MNKARFRCDVCGLDKEVEYDHVIGYKDDHAVVYTHLCDTGQVVALDPFSVNGIVLDEATEEE